MPSDTPQQHAVNELPRQTTKHLSDNSQTAVSLPTSHPPPPSMSTSSTAKSGSTVHRQISCEWPRDPYSKLLQYYETYLPPSRKQGRWVDSPNGENTVWVPDRFSMASTSSMISNVNDDLEGPLRDGASECQGSLSASERFATGDIPINIRIIPPTPAPSIRNSGTAVGRNRSTRSTRSIRSIRSNRRIRVVGESPSLPPIDAGQISLSHQQPNGDIDQFLLSPTPLDRRHAVPGEAGKIVNPATVRQHVTPVNSCHGQDSSAGYLTVRQHPDDPRPNTAANSSRYDRSISASAIPATVTDLPTRPSSSCHTRLLEDTMIDNDELNDDDNGYGDVYHFCDGEIVVSELDEDLDSDAYHNTLRYTTDDTIGCENFGVLGEELALVRSKVSQTAYSTTGNDSRHSIGPESRRDRIIRESGSSSPSHPHSSGQKGRKFSSSSVLSTVSSLSSSSITNSAKLPWRKIWSRKSY
ncbi:hypothetical protein V1525DRAFT_409938 [Lipomyces kononenkoae]|uniref:Uncharacterized protein n=1 Tax=Lipomyces kononenkoae TaxID=34357 RepID=A0ACC3SUX0_LIPKO